MEDVDEFENETAFIAGLRHPLLGWDHCLLALAVGAVAVSATRRPRLLVPALIISVAGGGLVTLQGWLPPMTFWSSSIAVTAALLLLAARDRLPFQMQAAVISVAGALQGMDHAIAWPLDSAAPAYQAGIVATTLLLACIGALIASMMRLAILTTKIPALSAR